MMTPKEVWTRGEKYFDHVEHQSRDYLAFHKVRLAQLYNFCSAHLSSGDRLLSIGAGSATVECLLCKDFDIKCTVFDFPEAIQKNKTLYDLMGMETISGNLLSDERFEEMKEEGLQFDAILAAEIIEHLPIPPSQIYDNLAKVLKPGGKLLNATPNLATLKNRMRGLFGYPTAKPPEVMWGDSTYENEALHRREYLASEIVSAAEKSGYKHLETRMVATWRKGMKGKVSAVVQHLVPPVRSNLMQAFEKQQ